MMKSKVIKNSYVIEFNRSRRDSLSWVIENLKALGYEVERVPNHLTTIRVDRFKGQRWRAFRRDIRHLLNPKKGSAVVLSDSGKAWVCSMKGNRPGKFVKVMG